MYMTDYFENKMAKLMTGEEGGFTKPAKYYLGLYSYASDESVTEVAAADYKRQEIVLKSDTQNGYVTNAEDVVFDMATSTWDGVKYACICESLTGKNELIRFYTSSTIYITKGQQIIIKANTLKFYFS